MKSLTQREVDLMCKKHELYLQGNPEGERADFSDCDLSRLNLVGKNVMGVSFEFAKLDGCNMDRIIADMCDFSNASLNGVYLHEASATKCEFYHADLSGSAIDKVNCFDSNFEKADLSNTSQYAMQAANCNFKGATFDNSHMTAISLSNSNLENVTMRKCDLTGRADMSYCNLSGANLNESNLRDANLANTVMNNTKMYQTQLFNVNMRMADVENTDLSTTFNLDTANLDRIQNFDLEAYKQSKKENERPLTPIQAVQMPVYNAYYQAETEKDIEKGKFYNPLAQETYFKGKENPLAQKNPLYGESVKPKIVDLHTENKPVQESYLGGNKGFTSMAAMKEAQAQKANSEQAKKGPMEKGSREEL